MTTGPLGGIKVLEVGEMVAAPYCARILGDLGAEVWKVEPPGTGDRARSIGPFPGDVPDGEKSALFLYVNVGKRGLTLDLSATSGQQLFRDLVRQVDVLVEDRIPGQMKAWGLDFARLSLLNPRLIMASITPFGQTGPHATYKAYPLNTFHAGGEAYFTSGGPHSLDRAPIKQGNYIGEYECAIACSVPVMGALLLREQTGVGRQLDLAKQQCLIYFNAADLSRYPTIGWVTTRHTRYYPLGGRFPCKDGHVHFAANFEEHWRGLMQLMGDPEWSKDKPLSYWKASEERAEEAQKNMEPWLMARTRAEIFHEAQAAGVHIGPQLDAGEALQFEQYTARQFFVELDHPEAGKLPYASVPYHFSRTPAGIERPAPLLGQDNEAIYCGLLGLTPADLTALRAAGAI